MEEQTVNTPESTIDTLLDKMESGKSEPVGEPAPESTQPEVEVAEGDTAPTDKTEESPDEVAKTDGTTVKDPVRERLARQRDAERQKVAELQSQLQQFEKQMTEWQGAMNRPEVIRARMKDEGYTDEAISARLKSMGHDVPDTRPDVFTLIKNKLGVDPSGLDDGNKAVIGDMAKIFDVLLEDRMARILPNQLSPIQKSVTEIARREHAKEMFETMQSTVKEEGVLDYEKDVLPELSKFIEANPNSTQEDVLKHFWQINHKVALDRLRSKDKKVERTEKKEVLKGKVPEGGVLKPGGWKSPTSGKDLNKDVDDLLNSFNIR